MQFIQSSLQGSVFRSHVSLVIPLEEGDHLEQLLVGSTVVIGLVLEMKDQSHDLVAELDDWNLKDQVLKMWKVVFNTHLWIICPLLLENSMCFQHLRYLYFRIHKLPKIFFMVFGLKYPFLLIVFGKGQLLIYNVNRSRYLIQTMSDNKIIYLGLCAKYEPPVIAIHYKQRPQDTKKKLYTIILQKLVFHPDPMEAAKILYQEHPHILKESKIPVIKIASLIAKIQEELQLAEDGDYPDDYQDEGEEVEQKPAQSSAVPQSKPAQKQAERPAPRRPKFLDNEFEDDGPLNRSS